MEIGKDNLIKMRIFFAKKWPSMTLCKKWLGTTICKKKWSENWGEINLPLALATSKCHRVHLRGSKSQNDDYDWQYFCRCSCVFVCLFLGVCVCVCVCLRLCDCVCLTAWAACDLSCVAAHWHKGWCDNVTGCLCASEAPTVGEVICARDYQCADSDASFFCIAQIWLQG